MAAELTTGSITRSPELITAVIVCAGAGAATDMSASKDAAAHATCAGLRWILSNNILCFSFFFRQQVTVHAMPRMCNG
jgi:Na+/H+ antiporter NhaC